MIGVQQTMLVHKTVTHMKFNEPENQISFRSRQGARYSIDNVISESSMLDHTVLVLFITVPFLRSQSKTTNQLQEPLT